MVEIVLADNQPPVHGQLQPPARRRPQQRRALRPHDAPPHAPPPRRCYESAATRSILCLVLTPCSCGCRSAQVQMRPAQLPRACRVSSGQPLGLPAAGAGGCTAGTSAPAGQQCPACAPGAGGATGGPPGRRHRGAPCACPRSWRQRRASAPRSAPPARDGTAHVKPVAHL